MRPRALVRVLALGADSVRMQAQRPPARVSQFADLTSVEVAALDPARTAFVLLNGPLEEHPAQDAWLARARQLNFECLAPKRPSILD